MTKGARAKGVRTLFMGDFGNWLAEKRVKVFEWAGTDETALHHSMFLDRYSVFQFTDPS
jgi:hypothetical protein